MDVIKILNTYSDIATELGNDSARNLINEFIDKSVNNKYELPLIGQFSSGKSATINHLLGRDLLPTKSIETTAFATFISYSDSEYAMLEMADGSIEDISIADVKQLDNRKVVEEGKQIKSLTIGLNSDVLKAGLTFVDTPGVNTIITTHIDITERILKSAQCIIYVVAKGLTDEDALMIQTIEAKNIPVIYVRTHIDNLKGTEENWKETIHNDEKNIADKVGHPIRFFAISNDVTKDEFNSNFEALKDYISKEIANNVKEVFENAILERLVPIRKELESSINIKIQTIEQTVGKSIEEIEEQKAKIETLVNNWNEKLSSQQGLISKKAGEVKTDLTQTMRITVENSIDNFNKLINNSEGDINSLNIAISDNLSQTSSMLNSKVESIIQDGANSVCRNIGEEMMSIGSELHTIGLEGDFVFDMSVASDYAERQKSIDEEFIAKVAQINDIKEKVSQQTNLSNQEKAELEHAISMVEEEITAYRTNLSETTGSYSPLYVEKQSRLASIGKNIGTTLDIAMLFIPSSGWLKAGAWVSKIGKSGSTVRKVGEALGKGAKILAKTDAAKDAATLLGGLQNANDKINGKMKKTSVLDYVSLSYWFEKAGEHFDPTTCELDQQYEQQFRTRVNEAESELHAVLDKKKTMIANLARLNGEKWKVEQDLLEAENMRKSLIRETEAIKSSLESEKKKAVRNSLLLQAKQEFEKRINDYREILSRRANEMVETVFSSIINSADLKITSQLSALSEQLLEIKNNKDEYVKNRDQKLSHYSEMVSKLSL